MSTTVAKATKSGTNKRARKPRNPEPLARAQQARQAASEDQIRLRAYILWVAAGRPSGDGVGFWLAAEQELRDGIVCANEELGHRFPQRDMDRQC